MKSPRKKPELSDARGFTVVELLIVTVLVAIVTTFALVSFRKSNRNFELAGAGRAFSSYCEQARLDAIRRHGGASVVLNSNNSYTVNMDFDGSGTTGSRTINMPADTTISYTLPPAATVLNPSVSPVTIAYNWRGRTNSVVAVTLTDAVAGVRPSTFVLGPAGDISNETAVTGPVTTPTPRNTAVTTTTGIKSMTGY